MVAIGAAEKRTPSLLEEAPSLPLKRPLGYAGRLGSDVVWCESQLGVDRWLRKNSESGDSGEDVSLLPLLGRCCGCAAGSLMHLSRLLPLLRACTLVEDELKAPMKTFRNVNPKELSSPQGTQSSSGRRWNRFSAGDIRRHGQQAAVGMEQNKPGLSFNRAWALRRPAMCGNNWGSVADQEDVTEIALEATDEQTGHPVSLLIVLLQKTVSTEEVSVEPPQLQQTTAASEVMTAYEDVVAFTASTEAVAETGVAVAVKGAAAEMTEIMAIVCMLVIL
ncbi:hypothetical protein MLD38_021106 [Melastoma candidum]|uniref:Uncharacterized protein n=1 Tax=Melastoma candidum TaxID=119954 RepID=A0ACB9QEB2_9MYRT|nr:hypothetical protein MLD38_021106 [Melastoma candidum]